MTFTLHPPTMIKREVAERILSTFRELQSSEKICFPEVGWWDEDMRPIKSHSKACHYLMMSNMSLALSWNFTDDREAHYGGGSCLVTDINRIEIKNGLLELFGTTCGDRDERRPICYTFAIEGESVELTSEIVDRFAESYCHERIIETPFGVLVGTPTKEGSSIPYGDYMMLHEGAFRDIKGISWGHGTLFIDTDKDTLKFPYRTDGRECGIYEMDPEEDCDCEPNTVCQDGRAYRQFSLEDFT